MACIKKRGLQQDCVMLVNKYSTIDDFLKEKKIRSNKQDYPVIHSEASRKTVKNS